MTYRYSVPTSQRTEIVFIIKTDGFMLLRATSLFFWGASYRTHKFNAWQNAGFLAVSAGVIWANRYRSVLAFQYKEHIEWTVLILSQRPWPAIGRLLTDKVQVCCTQRTRKSYKFRPSLFHNNISKVQWGLYTQVTFSGINDWCTVSTAHLCFSRFSKWSSWRNKCNFSYS
jgi:hypothetical protein